MVKRFLLAILFIGLLLGILYLVPYIPKSVVLHIDSQEKDCYTWIPQKCLMVRESSESAYGFFSDNIEGFSFESGYQYKILVTKRKWINPPQDVSNISWKLIKVLEKRAVE
jgi:hypothetical protein